MFYPDKPFTLSGAERMPKGGVIFEITADYS
jgi:hypothetical protein